MSAAGYFVGQVLPNLIANVLWIPAAGLAGWAGARLHARQVAEQLREHLAAELHRHYIVPPPIPPQRSTQP